MSHDLEVGPSLDTLIDKGWALARAGQPASGLQNAELLLRRSRQACDRNAQAEAFTQSAWFSLQYGLIDQGYVSATEAKRAWIDLENVRGRAIASSILSWLVVEMGLVDEAFTEAELGLALAERQSDRSVLAFAQNAKAVTYLYCRQDHLAVPLMEKALATIHGHDAASLQSLILTNKAYSYVSIAEAAEREGREDEGREWRLSAIEINAQAVDIAARCGDFWNLRTAICNGAEYHVCLGNLAEAERYLDRLRGLDGEVGPRSEIHYLYTLGEFLTKSGRLEEALATCRQAVELAFRHNQADHRANTCRRLAETLEAMGDYAGALEYQKRFHAAFETQMGQTTRRRAQYVESTLELGKLRQEAERLKFQAEHDALTGLANRRSFEHALAALGDSRFCLAILDLDHFKSVNDTHSHIVGDSVLIAVAGILATNKAWDAFRIGGEEFALIFTGHTVDAARQYVEAIRRAVEAHDWSAIAPGLTMTASIGLVSSQTTAATEMLKTADLLLYRAKANGRNQVFAQ